MRIGEKLIVAALIVIMIHSLLVIVMGQRVESQVMALKEQGYPTSCAELAPPPVPSAENGASIYAVIFKQLKTPAYKKVDSLLSDLLDPAGHPPTPARWQEAERALTPYQDIPALVEQAEARPACQFPINWAAGYNALLPHLGNLRVMSRLLIAEARIAANEHHSSEAYRLITLALRLESSLSDEPILISQMVRMALVNSACDALKEIAQPGNTTDANARDLTATLAHLDMAPMLGPAMRGERTAGVELFQMVGSRPGEVEELVKGIGGGGEVRLFVRLEGTYLGRPLLYTDELEFLRRDAQQVDTVSEPSRLSVERGGFQDVPRWAVLTQLILPATAPAIRRRDAAIAHVAGSRIFLALLTYRSRNGSYPSSLAALSSLLGGSVPDDPFSGRGFVYHRQSSGFTLYSIGPKANDQVSGGGEEGRSQTSTVPATIAWSRS